MSARKRYFGWPLTVDPADLRDALSETPELLEQAAELLDMSAHPLHAKDRERLQQLMRNDLDYLGEHFNEDPRPRQTIERLRGTMGRTTFEYNMQRLALAAFRLNVAAAVLSQARGDFYGTTVWCAVGFASPVSPVTRPGQMVGLCAASGDMWVPAAMALAPSAAIGMRGYTAFMLKTLETINEIEEALSRCREAPEEWAHVLDLDKDVLEEYRCPHTLIVPGIPTNRGGAHGLPSFAYADREQVLGWALMHQWSTLIETTESPSSWRELSSRELHELIRRNTAELNIPWREDRVRYRVRHEKIEDDVRLVRPRSVARMHAGDPDDEIDQLCRTFDSVNLSWNDSVVLTEFLVSNPHLSACARRTGKQLTPVLLQSADDDFQTIASSLRGIFNSRLVGLARRRQDKEGQRRQVDGFEPSN